MWRFSGEELLRNGGARSVDPSRKLTLFKFEHRRQRTRTNDIEGLNSTFKKRSGISCHNSDTSLCDSHFEIKWQVILQCASIDFSLLPSNEGSTYKTRHNAKNENDSLSFCLISPKVSSHDVLRSASAKIRLIVSIPSEVVMLRSRYMDCCESAFCRSASCRLSCVIKWRVMSSSSL